MNRRLTGNHGVSDLGTKKEKKMKPKRTPGRMFVLGAVVDTMLDELCEHEGVNRAEWVRTAIVKGHKKAGLS